MVAQRLRDEFGLSCPIFDAATYPLSSSIYGLGVPGTRTELRVGRPLARTVGPGVASLLLGRSTMDRTTVPLDIGTTVWWRRFRKPILHPDLQDADLSAFARETLNSTLRSALGKCTVVNSWHAEESADWKPYQLQLAVDCCLAVPETICSSDQDEIETFVAKIEASGRRVVYKHASSSAAFGMPTRIVDAAARQRFASLKYAPTLFQAEVSGGVDLRVAVVGETIFCCEWRGSDKERHFADIKLENDPRMYPAVFPAGARTELLNLHRRLGLRLGIYDFKLDTAGTPFFLEVNPSGQWLDMELEGGQGVSLAIAQMLAGVEMGEKPARSIYTHADLERAYASAVPPRGSLEWQPVFAAERAGT